VNYEDGEVYGDSKKGRNLLSGFTDSHPDHFEAGEQNEMGLMDYHHELPLWGRMNNIKQSVKKSEDAFMYQLVHMGKGMAQERMNEVQAGYNQWMEKSGEVSKAFKEGMNGVYFKTMKYSKSMLYGSDVFSMMRDSDDIFKTFQKNHAAVKSNYERTLDFMRDQLSQKHRSP
jgi:hypothetical protein